MQQPALIAICHPINQGGTKRKLWASAKASIRLEAPCSLAGSWEKQEGNFDVKGTYLSNYIFVRTRTEKLTFRANDCGSSLHIADRERPVAIP